MSDDEFDHRHPDVIDGAAQCEQEWTTTDAGSIRSLWHRCGLPVDHLGDCVCERGCGPRPVRLTRYEDVSQENEREVDPRLVEILREAGDEWGPLGVALAAAELTDRDVLVRRLIEDEPHIAESHLGGEVATRADLPATAADGDAWLVTDEGRLYVRAGGGWSCGAGGSR